MPTASATGRAIHSAYDPWHEALAWGHAQAKLCQSGEIAVVLGVGLLYHAEALRQSLPEGCSLAVVVSDLKEFRDACVTRTIDQWAGQVAWIWGNPEDMAMRLAVIGRPLRFLSYAPAARLHADTHARLESLIKQQVASHTGGQLHVAVVGPIYGGSLPIARYTVSALNELGHRVTWIDHHPHQASYQAMEALKDARHRLTMQSRFAELLGQLTLARVAEDPPDLILALAQAPFTLPVLELLRRKKFLTAMWFVENHRHLTYWQQVAGGYDFWFVIQQGTCDAALRRAGATDVSYLPLAADPSIHRPLTLTDGERATLGADVSFVGAGYANRRTVLPRLLSQEWTFKLWGNEWEGATGLEKVLQRGGTRIETETCVKVFNATKVNVNLHSFVGEGFDPDGDFVNPRTFELAACGAFQVVDRRSLLPALFTSDQMVMARSADGLVSQVRAWLRDEAGRRDVVQAARARVLAEHTYVHRMRTLLAHVGVSQPDRVGSILRGDRQAASLIARGTAPSEVLTVLQQFPKSQRTELKDVAARIRARGTASPLSRDEILILMLDEYRMETRDMV
jgi:spore maturation protein CgeB